MNGSRRAPNRDRVRTDSFGDSPDPAVLAGQEGDDAVVLAQLMGPEHDRLVAVEGHWPLVSQSRGGIWLSGVSGVGSAGSVVEVRTHRGGGVAPGPQADRR